MFRYGRPPAPTAFEIEAIKRQREAPRSATQAAGHLDGKHPGRPAPGTQHRRDGTERPAEIHEPATENILYFLEKHSPVLEPWQCEILRIVRSMAQYIYPQKQTKVMNEGCATFSHYYIINRLYEKGLITQGAFMEMMHSHTNVIMQPEFDDPRFSGINPYALGFAMMQDIRRICTDPTDEDREWFPDFAGDPDWKSVMKAAWANYRDESFILQFLSPRLIRDFKLFVVTDDAAHPELVVSPDPQPPGLPRSAPDLCARI